MGFRMKHNRLSPCALARPAALLFIWFSLRLGGAPSAAKTADNSAPPNAVPSGPADLPQWRGAERNGLSKDTGLIKQWPSSGPQKTWSISNLGEGFGSLAIKGDHIYLHGNSAN